MKLHKNALDLTGKKFNRLSVVKYSHSHKRHTYWVCECECGATKTIAGTALRTGHTKSCGCLNKDLLIQSNKDRALAPEIARFNRIFKAYTEGAHTRGYVFELSRDEMMTVCLQPCHYCGADPEPYSGMDRVDNSIGYTVPNVVPCCKTCNYAKRDSSYDDFLKWINRLVEKKLSAEKV